MSIMIGCSPIHDYDLPNHLMDWAFNEERDVHDTYPLPPKPVSDDFPEHGAANSRMYNGVQLRSLCGIGEDDRAKLLSVQRPVLLHDLVPKVRLYLGEGWGARFDHLAGDDVCINDGESFRLQKGGYGRLARRNPSCQAND